MHSRIERFLQAALLAGALATGGVAHAGEHASAGASCAAVVPGVVNEAPAGRGFAGTVVDLSCDVVRPAGGLARCDSGEHYFALRMDGERGLRPLQVVGSTAEAERLHAGELTGKQVCVRGERSPTGVLLVTDIHPLG